MAVSLSYLDIRRIAGDFDKVHQGAPLTDMDYRTINFYKTTAEELNRYVVGKYFSCKQPSNPLVEVLLDLYKGTTWPPREPVRFNLNAASQAILIKLDETPIETRQELGYFKQLLDVVFKDYFRRLSPEEKIEMARRWEEVPAVVPRLEEIAKWQDLNLKISSLQALLGDLIGFDPATYTDTIYLPLLRFSHHLGRLKNETWAGCAERCHLENNYTALILFSVVWGCWVRLKVDLNSGERWVFLVGGLLLLLGLYNLFLKYIPGAVLYGYRRYYNRNAQERAELHRSIGQFIEAQKTKAICHAPSPGLIEKWRNRAVEIIIAPQQG
jgi:hypothetical protein